MQVRKKQLELDWHQAETHACFIFRGKEVADDGPSYVTGIPPQVGSGGLRPLVELCVEPAGLCGRCTGVAVPLRVVPSPLGGGHN